MGGDTPGRAHRETPKTYVAHRETPKTCVHCEQAACDDCGLLTYGLDPRWKRWSQEDASTNEGCHKVWTCQRQDTLEQTLALNYLQSDSYALGNNYAVVVSQSQLLLE